MHNLSVAYNWDLKFVDEIVKNGYPVVDLYASLPHSTIGGGRPSVILPGATKESIVDQVGKIHDAGIQFTYTLNAPCMGGQEFLPETHRHMLDELQFIQDAGCDGVVVSIPYIVELIREQFPKLKVRVSTIAKINSVNKAMYYEGMGANSFTPDVMINRDFKVLEAIVQATKMEISLLLTDGCLYECPYRLYHYGLMGHASQTYSNRATYMDYPVISCSIDKLTKPAEVIKCRWVRPEDIPNYQEIGINTFKIGGRRLSTERLLDSVKAYSELKYEGNLADIIEGFSFSMSSNAGPRTAHEGRTIVTIDNTKLDGFIDFFKTKDCASGCATCSYCEKWAEKAVKTTWIESETLLVSLRAARDGLVSSRAILTNQAKPRGKKRGKV
jgi:collagenase-like PrtC family protease